MTNEEALAKYVGMHVTVATGGIGHVDRKALLGAQKEVLARMRERPKLNTDVTPEIVAMLDGSAAREDEARWIAKRALNLAAAETLAGGDLNSVTTLVALVSTTLAEARRQVAEARVEG